MSASEPITIDIDDSDAEAGASFGGDDGNVLHFEPLDMPFGQSIPSTTEGDEAGSRTTLVPAMFFHDGALANASELEPFSGDDAMFLESDDDVEEMEMDSPDGNKLTHTWTHEYSSDPLDSDGPESEPEPEPIAKNKNPKRTSKDTHLSRANRLTVDAWGHSHRLTQDLTALTELVNADVKDISPEWVASLKAVVAKLTADNAAATALIHKCDLTLSSRRVKPIQLTDQDTRQCDSCITARRTCIATEGYLERWEPDPTANTKGKYRPKAEQRKRPPSCWSCTSSKFGCRLLPTKSKQSTRTQSVQSEQKRVGWEL